MLLEQTVGSEKRKHGCLIGKKKKHLNHALKRKTFFTVFLEGLRSSDFLFKLLEGYKCRRGARYCSSWKKVFFFFLLEICCCKYCVFLWWHCFQEIPTTILCNFMYNGVGILVCRLPFFHLAWFSYFQLSPYKISTMINGYFCFLFNL